MPASLMYSPKRILVVEDDLVVSAMLKMALTVDGHSVKIAHDADEALSFLQSADYDLVMTDFKLGGLMDGLELAEAIKKSHPLKPIILITAYADRIGTDMGQVSNIDLLLRKPVSVMDLHNALKKLFPDK